MNLQSGIADVQSLLNSTRKLIKTHGDIDSVAALSQRKSCCVAAHGNHTHMRINYGNDLSTPWAHIRCPLPLLMQVLSSKEFHVHTHSPIPITPEVRISTALDFGCQQALMRCQPVLRKLGKNDECPVCLECIPAAKQQETHVHEMSQAFALSDDVTTLPCGHSFHDKCCGEWFKTSRKCPICRFEVTMHSVEAAYYNQKVETQSTPARDTSHLQSYSGVDEAGIRMSTSGTPIRFRPRMNAALVTSSGTFDSLFDPEANESPAVENQENRIQNQLDFQYLTEATEAMNTSILAVGYPTRTFPSNERPDDISSERPATSTSEGASSVRSPLQTKPTKACESRSASQSMLSKLMSRISSSFTVSSSVSPDT